MEFVEILHVGMAREETFVVASEHLAAHVGSGSARVLATPWMIAFMERTARDLLAEALPEGYSSVGVHVNVRHLAPSPAGRSCTWRKPPLIESAEKRSARTVGSGGVESPLRIRVWASEISVLVASGSAPSRAK